MVLEVQPLGARRVPGDLVHALPELGILLALWQELRPDALVARRPRGSSVRGLVDPARRDRGRHRVRLLRVRQDRVEGLAAEACTPLGTVRMLPEPALELER